MSEHAEIIERLAELEQEVADQALKIERLAKHVSKLSDGLSETLQHLKGFFEVVGSKLPKEYEQRSSRNEPTAARSTAGDTTA